MKITAKLGGQEKSVVVPKSAKVLDALRELKINPETVIVKREKEIIMDEELLGEGDEIEIIKVVSGG